ncbi:MAG: helix-hairpin-helix domain-containing protein [Turicibacter sp.]|nr:helix-hairpin-helix domain-containing protein [Turicibacter sp.]
MKKQLMIVVIAVFVMMTIFYVSRSSSSEQVISLDTYKEDEQEIVEERLVESVEEEYILTCMIDVKGQVKVPGIYEVDENFRIYDVIELAGGLLETANVDGINLAQKVRDEMVIYVPHIEDSEEQLIEMPSQVSDSEKVSLNQATMSELETLPGIGPSKATAIIQYREEFGKFKSLEELTNVSGIGEKTLEKLRDYLEL